MHNKKPYHEQQYTTSPGFCLVSFTRRGALLYYHIHLTNALLKHTPVKTIVAQTADAHYLSKDIKKILINTGKGGAVSTILHLPKTLWQFAKAMRYCKTKYFHFTGIHELNVFVGLLLKLKKSTILYSVHDPVDHLGAPIHMVLMEKIFRRMVDAYFVLCKDGQQNLMKQGVPHEKIITSNIGNLFLTPVKKDVPGGNIILFQGRIEPYKGLDVLLQAARNTLTAFPDWRLVIAGTGKYVPDPKLIDHPQIQWINNFIAVEKLPDLFEKANFLVLPYTEATQSALIPMAMVSGKPVIITNVGGLPELVEDGKTGFIIPPFDEASLSAAMEKLMKNPTLCEQMGRNAYIKFNNELTWDHIALDHMEGYVKFFGPAS